MATVHQTNTPALRRTHSLRHISWTLLRWSALAGVLGGLLGWVAGEPVNVGGTSGPAYSVYAGVFLYFLILSAGVGTVLGALPGALNRSWRQVLRGAIVGCLVGGIGGGVGGLPAQFVYTALGAGLVARAAGWAIVGAFIGLCPGAATRDSRRARRGIVGGLLGGFAGGLLFNLVAYALPHSPTDTGTASRFVADLVVGLCIGLLLAMVEVVAKHAWLTALGGKREGAQFILSKNITLIGRDDRDDVILWGDPLLATRHARIERARGSYLLECLSADAPTLVNGQPVRGTTALRDGDEIVLGSTRLQFHTRGKLPAQQASHATAAVAAAPAPPSAAPAHVPLAMAPVAAPTPVQAAGRSAATPPVLPTPHEQVATGVMPGYRLVGQDPVRQTYDLLPVGPDVVTIGRDADNDIAIDDATVSARHAELRREAGRWVAHDLGSTNGTYVSYGGAPQDERRIERNALKAGSTVRFGGVAFSLEGAIM